MPRVVRKHLKVEINRIFKVTVSANRSDVHSAIQRDLISSHLFQTQKEHHLIKNKTWIQQTDRALQWIQQTCLVSGAGSWLGRSLSRRAGNRGQIKHTVPAADVDPASARWRTTQPVSGATYSGKPTCPGWSAESPMPPRIHFPLPFVDEKKGRFLLANCSIDTHTQRVRHMQWLQIRTCTVTCGVLAIVTWDTSFCHMHISTVPSMTIVARAEAAYEELTLKMSSGWWLHGFRACYFCAWCAHHCTTRKLHRNWSQENYTNSYDLVTQCHMVAMFSKHVQNHWCSSPSYARLLSIS
jgi:hypothetical protein